MSDVSDSFNRADGAIGTADSGHVWSQLQGTWVVASNQAALSASAGDDQNIVVVDAAAADVTAQVTWSNFPPGVADSGLVLRVADATNYILVRAVAGFGTLDIFTRIAGTFANIASVSYTPTTGDVLKVITNGTAIDVYINGTLKLSATSSAGQTNTQHGLRIFQAIGDKFDDFTITLTSPPTTNTPRLNAKYTHFWGGR